jgi:hypothetical protein
VIPAAYTVLHDFGDWVGRKLHRGRAPASAH